MGRLSSSEATLDSSIRSSSGMKESLLVSILGLELYVSDEDNNVQIE